MKIIKTPKDMQTVRQKLTGDVGLVPTMGNLHAGHMSLLKRCVKENTVSIASIFVNPTQFNDKIDFDNYPSTIEADLDILKNCDIDYCFMPEANTMYPDNFQFQVHENTLSQLMEGRSRPGHFNGMLSIVLKLLLMTKPDNVYFGEKDYQQYLLVKNMSDAFFLSTNIIACPTVRDSTNLALSSRNNRLNKKEKEKAQQFAQIFHQEHTINAIKKKLTEKGIIIDYIEDYQSRRFAAVFINNIRLIDNYTLIK